MFKGMTSIKVLVVLLAVAAALGIVGSVGMLVQYGNKPTISADEQKLNELKARTLAEFDAIDLSKLPVGEQAVWRERIRKDKEEVIRLTEEQKRLNKEFDGVFKALDKALKPLPAP